jgi:hypothetical protein
MAVVSSVAYAEKGDITAPPSAEEKPAVLKTTSYFQGTWVGNWQVESRTGRAITITVGQKSPDGTFDVEYSWESGRGMDGRSISAGTVKAKGREDGETLVFDFNDPVTNKSSGIVMKKYEDVRAKAIWQGMIGSRFVPEAYLTRK